jgi:O-antigen ligase
VLTPHVVDPVYQQTPLDALSIVIFALAFAGIVYASVRKPSLGIALLILTVPFDFSHDVGRTTITLTKIALLANAAALLLRRRDPRAIAHGTQRTLVLCQSAVILATALSFFGATYHGAVARETLKASEYLCIFIVCAIAFRADPDERPIRLALVWGVLFVSVLAISQEVFGAPSGIWFDNVAIPRVAGPLEGPNQLAAYLGLTLAVLVAFVIRRPNARFEIATLAIASTALALTISRSGLLASFAGIALVLCIRRGPQMRPIITALSGGFLAGVLIVGLDGFLETHKLHGFGVLDRFSTIAEAEAPGAVGTRSELWRAAFVLWRAHPLLGIGAGNFERELGLAGYPMLRTHANSLYLQALVEGGLPLFGATLALVYASVAKFARGPFSDPLVAGVFGASAGLAGHQIFDLLSFYPKVGDQWWIWLALACVRVDQHNAERS